MHFAIRYKAYFVVSAVLIWLACFILISIVAHSMVEAIVFNLVISIGLIPWVKCPSKVSKGMVKFIRKSIGNPDRFKSRTYPRMWLRRRTDRNRMKAMHFYTAPRKELGGQYSIRIIVGRIGRVFVAVFGISSTIVGLVVWLLSPHLPLSPVEIFVFYSLLSIVILAFAARTLMIFWTFEDYGVRQYDGFNRLLFIPLAERAHTMTGFSFLLSVFSLSASHIFVFADVMGDFILVAPYCVFAVLIFHFIFENRFLKRLESTGEFSGYLEGELPEELPIR